MSKIVPSEDERHTLRASLLSAVRRVRTHMLGIGIDEADFGRRGFHLGDARVRMRLEETGRSFVTGYTEALRTRGPAELSARLDRLDRDLRGFAYEGAAMGMTVLDRLTGGLPRRWRQLLEGPGTAYSYLVFVGAGWAWARLPVHLASARRALDPLYGWLAIDGLGFYHGYFGARSGVAHLGVPRRLRGYERCAFDQGLGRSLWFVHCADVGRIRKSIEMSGAERRADLWSGVGLAATYAGPLDHNSVRELRSAGVEAHAALAQGAVFGATARIRGGNATPETEIGSRALAALDARAAAELAQGTLPTGLEARRDDAYQTWRLRIQSRFATSEARR